MLENCNRAAECLQAKGGAKLDTTEASELNSTYDIKSVAGPRPSSSGNAEGSIAIRPRILKEFEECIGPLNSLNHDGGSLVPTIGSIKVVLPPELESELFPLIGQKIGILRCDSVAKPYRIRSFG